MVLKTQMNAKARAEREEKAKEDAKREILRKDLEKIDFPSKVGKDLVDWCHHLYIVQGMGLGGYTEKRSIIDARILNRDLRYLVFLDLDETLTATNDFIIDEPYGKKEVESYMQGRVPAGLRTAVLIFLQKMAERKDIAVFILTDNIYEQAKCTLKLAYQIDSKPGSIIDRHVRAKYYNGMQKAEFIEYAMELRKENDLPPIKVLFADNDLGHRTAVDLKAFLNEWRAFVCCPGLEHGLSRKDIIKMADFLQIYSENTFLSEGARREAEKKKKEQEIEEKEKKEKEKKQSTNSASSYRSATPLAPQQQNSDQQPAKRRMVDYSNPL